MPKWIEERAAHIRAKNPEMSESASWAIATQQAHKLGRTPKDYGTVEGKKAALTKYMKPKTEYQKTAAFTLAELPVPLGSIYKGFKPGRSLAANTAGEVAPEGRKGRSEDIARALGTVTVPAGAIGALALSRKKEFGQKAVDLLAKKVPGGVVLSPGLEAQVVKNLLVPSAMGVGGSLAGGAATGGAVGGIQRLRGKKKEGAPMGFKPGAWRAQAGFTPKGFTTPAQKFQKAQGVGRFDPNKGLKPLDIKVAFQTSQYSGPLGPGRIKQESPAPPFSAPPLKAAGGVVEEKTASPFAAARLAKGVGRPRLTPPPGPSIAQISKPVGFGRPMPGATKTPKLASPRGFRSARRQLRNLRDDVEGGLDSTGDEAARFAVDEKNRKHPSPPKVKTALLERLVRLGATPIPRTPKLFMKTRSPQELKALQQGIDARYRQSVVTPLKQKFEPISKKLPDNKMGRVARGALDLVAENPEVAALEVLPGGTALSLGWVGAKRALEKGIDRVFPLPK